MNNKLKETVPCKICFQQTHMLGTELCDNCWELETRIARLIKTNQDQAIDWLFEKLREAINWNKG